MEGCQEGGPVWGDRSNKCDQVAGADNIHRTAEEVRCECCTHECCVATIGTAVDYNFLRVSDALLNCPVNSIHQVIVHVAAPFLIASIQEVFTVACGASEIHLQASVSTIGEP